MALTVSMAFNGMAGTHGVNGINSVIGIHGVHGFTVLHIHQQFSISLRQQLQQRQPKFSTACIGRLPY